jgi:hypothetical protein
MRILRVVVPVLLFVAAVGLPGAATLEAAPSSHPRFLVTATHTKEECLNALDEVKAAGSKLLDQSDWGCMAGDHSCYLIIEGKDEASVRKSLPQSWAKAKITSLNKFTAEQIASFHKK